MKVLKVSSALAVDAVEEDALPSKVKSSLHRLRCFLLYSTILLHFTPPGLWYELTIGLHTYMNCLLGFTMLYNWEFVKSFYFMFHRARMSKDIADEMGCSQANIYLETLHLVQKLAVIETQMVGPKRGGGLSTSQRYQPYPQIMAIQPNLCYCYNAGASCNGDICRFSHVYMHCAGPYMGHQCRSQNNNNNPASIVAFQAQGVNC